MLDAQKSEKPISLEELTAQESTSDMVDMGSDSEVLSPEEEGELAQEIAEVEHIDLSAKEKKVLEQVDSMEVTEEQKKELKHQVAFLFTATIFQTVLMTYGALMKAPTELAEMSTYSPALPVIFIIIMSSLVPLGALAMGGYGEAKRKLHEAEERLMDVSVLLGIDGRDPKEIMKRSVESAKSNKVALRRKKLAAEIALKKPKRGTTSHLS